VRASVMLMLMRPPSVTVATAITAGYGYYDGYYDGDYYGYYGGGCGWLYRNAVYDCIGYD
jgi:hypothetical protein